MAIEGTAHEGTTFVVDASAIAKLFLDEPESAAYRDWHYDALRAGDKMVAPALLRYEVGNIVRRNFPDLGADEQKRIWRDALAGIESDDGHVGDAFGTDGVLTFYDGCYIALGSAMGAELVTFDAAMGAVWTA